MMQGDCSNSGLCRSSTMHQGKSQQGRLLNLFLLLAELGLLTCFFCSAVQQAQNCTSLLIIWIHQEMLGNGRIGVV